MTRQEFLRTLESGRKAFTKADMTTRKIVQMLENAYPNINFDEVSSGAENADNILDAITCYMQYGEYSAEEIWNEIQNINKNKRQVWLNEYNRKI